MVGHARVAHRRVGARPAAAATSSASTTTTPSRAEAGARRLRARRGRLRPAPQHRHPRRQPRAQQEGHADGGRHPVRPGALLRARRLLLPADHPHGAGARDQGPGRGELRPADRRRRGRPRHPRASPPTEAAASTWPAASTATASCTATTAPAPRAPGFLLEGVHLRSDGFKELDGGGDTGSSKNEWMVKGRYLLSTDAERAQELSAQARLLRRGLERDLPGPDRRGLPRQPATAATAASRFDRMQWHRTQIAATLPRASFGRRFTIDAAVYRHDFDRTWRKVNRFGRPTDRRACSRTRHARATPIYYGVLTRRERQRSSAAHETIFIGPNQRAVRLAGRAESWRAGAAPRGPVEPPRGGRRCAFTTTASSACTPRTAS